jgi:hypothetical protein
MIFASTLAKAPSLSHALRKLFDSASSPGALFAPTLPMIREMSALPTLQSKRTVLRKDSSGQSLSGILVISPVAFGKKRSLSAFAFSSWLIAVWGSPGASRSAGRAGGSGLVWLRSRAHFSMSHIIFGFFDAFARELRQSFVCALFDSRSNSAVACW